MFIYENSSQKNTNSPREEEKFFSALFLGPKGPPLNKNMFIYENSSQKNTNSPREEKYSYT